MSREDFTLCTPDEFQAIYDAWFHREEAEMQRIWEVGRFVAALSIQPYSKKTIKPTDLILFPWERQYKEESVEVRGTSTESRAKEILARVENSGSPKMPGIAPVGLQTAVPEPQDECKAAEEQNASAGAHGHDESSDSVEEI